MSGDVAAYQCERKRRFDTWDECEAEALRTWEETHATPNPPGAYFCQHCGGYHMGRTGWIRGGRERQEKKARKWRARADGMEKP